MKRLLSLTAGCAGQIFFAPEPAGCLPEDIVTKPAAYPRRKHGSADRTESSDVGIRALESESWRVFKEKRMPGVPG